MTRDVVITGIGLVTSLGEGLEPHVQLLKHVPQPILDTQRFAPFPVHPAPPLNLDLQIPKKGDQRQMEPWQRLGVYAAGLAIENAGLKGNADLLSKMHMIVAAGGGERDPQVDETILNGLPQTADEGAFLNERLMNDLRPTLFLAQLSNLLAGNISIVHGVTGSSRTFMGEEMAGLDAIRTLHARIESGQGDIGLVGGAYNAERLDMLLLLAFGDAHVKGDVSPVWSREPGGMVTGSMGAFLVLEERSHALARGAKMFAKLSKVIADRCGRQPSEAGKNLEKMYDAFGALDAPCVVSCASGAAPVTGEEEMFWASKQARLRAVGSLLGHGLEAQAPLACALAALSLDAKTYFLPFEAKEKPAEQAPQSIIVSCCGHWRGEGLVLLESAGS